jgi:hypothetical protein
MQQGQAGNAAALADRLGVTERTIYRDLAVLADLGIPCYFDKDADCLRIRKDFFLPPVHLSTSEVLALLVIAEGHRRKALVLDHLDCHLLAHLRRRDPQVRNSWIRQIIDRVVLAPDRLTIELNTGQLEACKTFDWPKITNQQNTASTKCLYQPKVEKHRQQVVLTLAIQIKRLDGKRLLLSPEGQDLVMPTNPQPRDHMIQAIGKASAGASC